MLMKLSILISEFSEADVVTSLCAVKDNQFSYALASGIVGMYKGTERVWRVKVCCGTTLYMYEEHCLKKKKLQNY